MEPWHQPGNEAGTLRREPWESSVFRPGRSQWTGEQEQCKEVKDISMRVSAGEIMPAGECPECGALCHPREKFVFQNRDSLETFSIESVNLDSAAAQLLFHIGWSSQPKEG